MEKLDFVGLDDFSDSLRGGIVFLLEFLIISD